MAKKPTKPAVSSSSLVAPSGAHKAPGASSNLSFHGWRRENKRVGVRNHVLILPLDDLSNAACEAVANNIKGTLDRKAHV